MNTKTEEQMDAEAEAFLTMIEDNLPSSLRTEHMIRACGGILTSFCDGIKDVEKTMLLLAVFIREYYADAVGGCPCPECTAERKANAH